VRALVVDDHPLVQEAMGLLLRHVDPECITAGAGSCERGLAMAHEGAEPDLVLLDMSLPGLSDIPALKRWRADFPAVPVIVLSGAFDPQTVLAAMEAGASGFIPKSSSREVMLRAVRLVLEGGRYLPPDVLAQPSAAAEPCGRLRPTRAFETLGLTPRQFDVLRLIAQGKPNKLICRELGLAERTVKVHVTAVLRALKVTSRTQAAIAAGRLGLHQG
jgi:DNA-binding NarL/FixJ family response regulator